MKLRGNLTIANGLNKNKTWTHFEHITFRFIYDMLTNKVVFEDYVYRALEELRADHVIYAEFRANLAKLTDMYLLTARSTAKLKCSAH